jgi:hypothetical protein
MWMFAVMLQILVQYYDPVAVASSNFPPSQRHWTRRAATCSSEYRKN